MKVLLSIMLLVQAIAALAQEKCAQMEFSGEATQSRKYTQQLPHSMALAVNPMRFKTDPRWAWFEISVTPDNGDGIFVFTLGDRNWLLDASDFWSAFIGGPNSDLNSALEYRSRYLIFPVRGEEKQKTRQAASMIVSAENAEKLKRAISSLETLALAHLKFDVTNYGFGPGDLPRSVDWVSFEAKITFPRGRYPTDDSVTFVDCPMVPDEMIENMRNPSATTTLLQRTSDQPNKTSIQTTLDTSSLLPAEQFNGAMAM